jgi:hypothetical protein
MQRDCAKGRLAFRPSFVLSIGPAPCACRRLPGKHVCRYRPQLPFVASLKKQASKRS